MPKIQPVHSPDFIRKVNEAYHDEDYGTYEETHPGIFENQEMHARWARVARDHVAPAPGPRVLLDVGSGTGFVPLQLAPVLDRGDTMHCTDISVRMLETCRATLERQGFPCEVRYHKLDSGSFPLADGSVDCITMNSVLHHLPELDRFFAEVDRLLKSGGRLVVGHDPNKPFYSHPLLWNNFRLIRFFLDPAAGRGAALGALQRVGLLEPLRKLSRRARGLPPAAALGSEGGVTARVNERLQREGLIQRPLTGSEIAAMVDLHSPTAGGYHRDRGIDIHAVARAHLPGYTVEWFETYNHLYKMSWRNALTRRYDAWLRRTFPDLGATFLAVLVKP